MRKRKTKLKLLTSTISVQVKPPIVFHFMRTEDLRNFFAKTRCGLGVSAGIGTSRKDWVTCKRCLRSLNKYESESS